MEKRQVDELLKVLGLIGMFKGMLPFNLRGWVSTLGLFVRENQSGGWSRLQAGGKFRTYFDAIRRNEEAWEIRKFDEITWNDRFADIVEPTYEIADFLLERVTFFGNLDPEGSAILGEALSNYRTRGNWSGLPKIPEEMRERQQQESTYARQKEEREKRLVKISNSESRLRKDPLDRIELLMLPFMYYEEGRYKDAEIALKRLLEAEATKLGFQDSSTYKELGRVYLAALSNALRGKGTPIWGYAPSEITAASLGYNVDELRILAKEQFCKAQDIYRLSGVAEDSDQLKDIKLAIRASEESSDKAFEEFEELIIQPRLEELRKYHEDGIRQIRAEQEEGKLSVEVFEFLSKSIEETFQREMKNLERDQ